MAQWRSSVRRERERPEEAGMQEHRFGEVHHVTTHEGRHVVAYVAAYRERGSGEDFWAPSIQVRADWGEGRVGRKLALTLDVLEALEEAGVWGELRETLEEATEGGVPSHAKGKPAPERAQVLTRRGKRSVRSAAEGGPGASPSAPALPAGLMDTLNALAAGLQALQGKVDALETSKARKGKVKGGE